MRQTLIIGYGNPLRGDDGVGIRAAELLAGRGGETPPLLSSDVEVIGCQQLNVELAPLIAGVDRLILIDACASGEPGTIHEQALTPLLPVAGGNLTHHLDPRSLLTVAQMLYGKAPPTTLFTVSGSTFDYSETLSPPVAAALPALLLLLLERG